MSLKMSKSFFRHFRAALNGSDFQVAETSEALNCFNHNHIPCFVSEAWASLIINIFNGAKARHPSACAIHAPRRARGAADSPLLQPGYSCLHQERQFLFAEEVPLLIDEMNSHQLGLREGTLQIFLGTPVDSRLE
jgi:hypothetical protein